MAILGNLLWLLFGGFLSSLGYVLGGIAFCLTLIGIPFGLQSFRLAGATFAPFGKELVESTEAPGCWTLLWNILWLVLFGWEIALLHLIHAIILAVTIIGIPFAKQHWKLIPVALMPFGRTLRSKGHG